MGKNLFGVGISKLIKEHVAPGLLDATLIKVTPGTRTGGQLTGGTNPTTASHACKGFIEEQGVRNLDGTLVEDGMKQVVLIGDTIDSGNTFPVVGDRITIEGTTYNVEGVDRDPDAATYTCAVRSR